jgi:hypothetical protein
MDPDRIQVVAAAPISHTPLLSVIPLVSADFHLDIDCFSDQPKVDAVGAHHPRTRDVTARWSAPCPAIRICMRAGNSEEFETTHQAGQRRACADLRLRLALWLESEKRCPMELFVENV